MNKDQLNKLRASVLGANDGIVSTAGLVLGVTGAAAAKETILLAGFSGLVSGALSMAAGEFVSVSSQRDSEKVSLAQAKEQLATPTKAKIATLTQRYIESGLSKHTATQAAQELHANQRLDSALKKELGIDTEDLMNPWNAAIASAAAFVVGAAIPLAAIALSPENLQLPVTVGAVMMSLILTGALSAHAGQANKGRAALRVVTWGIGAMAITYLIGYAVGVNIG